MIDNEALFVPNGAPPEPISDRVTPKIEFESFDRGE